MNGNLQSLRAFISENKTDIIVLADKHTMHDCYPLLEVELPHFIVPYGEGYKNLNSCEYIWKKLTDMGATRNTMLLCLGGGVLCDMGSFAASCFQRGIKTALVPTSLLAMVDASVGGKTGVNFLNFKNYIGLFREPDHLFICREFLGSLPAKEWVNGYVEMLKHGLIADRAHYDEVKMQFLKQTNEVSAEQINHSIGIKLQHVKQDFEDLGIRKRLNFGHTVGHAIESHSLAVSEENKSLSHGVSVALGIIAESYISTKISGLSEESLQEIAIVLLSVLKAVEQDIPNFEALEPYLIKDKKNGDDGINFSLLSHIGSCTHDHIVPSPIIRESIEYLRNLK